jgi:hypothetical protein
MVHGLPVMIARSDVTECTLVVPTAPAAGSPAARHKAGIGTALLAALLDLADSWLGLRRLELHVQAAR